ncbi:MAG: hypothetical protein N3G48_03810 [Sulfolobales archaeon]|nr:hypothetical protein [Sulfolobales archaeon]
MTTPEQLRVNLINVGFNRCKCFTHGFPIIDTVCKVFRMKIIRSLLGLGGEIICIAEKVG